MNQVQKMKFDISSVIMPEMARVAGMSEGEYRNVYNSERFESMLENIMRVVKGSPIIPQFQVGQAVWHEHSGNGGIVRVVNLNDEKGYFYQVEFTVDFGVTRTDWYQGHVLRASQGGQESE